MTTFPGSAPALRGALVSIDFLSLQPLGLIPFQYNPHTLTRSFEVKPGISGPEAGQIGRAPNESIKLELELEGADGLLVNADTLGVAPQLAALQELISTSSLAVIANLVLLNLGTIEVAPPTTKLTLFVWGPKRVLPVVITELSVTEEAHDQNLNPLRARVSVGLRVLNWDDVGQTHPAFGIALAHKMQTEALALVNSLQSTQAVSF